jgi:hypothetical protein
VVDLHLCAYPGHSSSAIRPDAHRPGSAAEITVVPDNPEVGPTLVFEDLQIEDGFIAAIPIGWVKDEFLDQPGKFEAPENAGFDPYRLLHRADGSGGGLRPCGCSSTMPARRGLAIGEALRTGQVVGCRVDVWQIIVRLLGRRAVMANDFRDDERVPRFVGQIRTAPRCGPRRTSWGQ